MLRDARPTNYYWLRSQLRLTVKVDNRVVSVLTTENFWLARCSTALKRVLFVLFPDFKSDLLLKR